MKQPFLTASIFGALCSWVSADGIYTKSSPVLQVSGKDFNSLIEQSNHTSIVEFYAPWCGHCQNLKPAYEKAAKSLAGLAKVAAVNCDEESNKPLCGRMGVQGFPTLKIVKPGSKKGKPIIEDYQGPRSAKAIVDALVDKIPNHVKKVQDSELDTWLQGGAQAKAILFTEKGTTQPLIKALAVDFLGNIDFATIRSKEKESVEKYDVTKFPTFVLVPDGGKSPVTYDGEMKKDALVKFFSQVAPPNPDPAPVAKKTEASSKKTKNSASAEFSKASKAQKSSEYDEHMQAKTIELDDETPTKSPLPIVEHEEKPMVIKEAAPPVPTLVTATELEVACLTPKSGTCILVLLPPRDESGETQALASAALASFAEVAEKHHKRKSNIFPFYAIPSENEAAKAIREDLKLKKDTELDIIAINMKRKWWRQYVASGHDISDAENFVDAIRLGEGAKQKLAANFYSNKKPASEEAVDHTPGVEPVVEAPEAVEPSAATPEPAPKAEAPIHNEL